MLYLILVTWAARLLGAWTLVNGVIHNIAVLLEDRPYDRHLLYLLMIGGILFFSGFVELVSSWGLKKKEWWAVTICLAGSVFVISLTLSLLPIFKALGTLIMHSVLIVLVLVSIFVKNGVQANNIE